MGGNYVTGKHREYHEGCSKPRCDEGCDCYYSRSLDGDGEQIIYPCERHSIPVTYGHAIECTCVACSSNYQDATTEYQGRRSLLHRWRAAAVEGEMVPRAPERRDEADRIGTYEAYRIGFEAGITSTAMGKATSSRHQIIAWFAGLLLGASVTYLWWQLWLIRLQQGIWM